MRGSTNVFINLVIDKTANSIYEGMIRCLPPRIYPGYALENFVLRSAFPNIILQEKKSSATKKNSPPGRKLDKKSSQWCNFPKLENDGARKLCSARKTI